MSKKQIEIGLALTSGLALLAYQAGRARAYDIPTIDTLAFSGSLLTFGAPDNSSHQMSIALYVNGSTTAACGSTATSSITCVNGQFTIPVPSTCIPIIHANPNLEVQVTVDNTPLGMAPISAVPYAVEADTASNAAASSTLGTAISTLQSQVVTLQGQVTTLQNQVAALQAATPVAASYTGSTTTVTSGSPVVVYTGKVVDTNNAYNTSNGVYTVPVTGTYHVGAAISYVNEFGSIEVRRCIILHNGAQVTQGAIDEVTATGATSSISSAAVFAASAGDSITVEGDLSSSSGLDGSNGNYFHVHLIH